MNNRHIQLENDGLSTGNKRQTVGASMLLLLALCLLWHPASIQAQWTANGTNIFSTNTGNVGVGTTSPLGKFEVADSTTYLAFVLNNKSATGQAAYHLQKNGVSKWQFGMDFAANGTPDWYVFDQANAKAKIYANSAGTLNLGANAYSSPAMSMLDGGNVGIGTTAPVSKLHVAGNIQVDGNINAKYQDVAEWVESSQTLASGTVVILDADKNNQVVASTSAYDTTVAGVVSERPGVLLGEGGAGKAMIATTGRVKVRVDATKSPVKIGDILVTGTIAGTAMKSIPIDLNGVKIHRPGTIIGKALQPLAGGTREILVLLSLQ